MRFPSIVGLFFCAAAAFLFVGTCVLYSRLPDRSQLTLVKGTVTGAAAVNTAKVGEAWMPLIRYTYRWNGELREGNRIEFEVGTVWQELADKVVQKYPVGSVVDVHVLSDGSAVLEPGVPFQLWVAWAVSAAAFCVALFALWWERRTQNWLKR